MTGYNSNNQSSHTATYQGDSTPLLLSRYHIGDIPFTSPTYNTQCNTLYKCNGTNKNKLIDYGIDISSVDGSVTSDPNYLMNDYDYDESDYTDAAMNKRACCYMCCNNSLDYVLQIVLFPCYALYYICGVLYYWIRHLFCCVKQSDDNIYFSDSLQSTPKYQRVQSSDR